MISLLESKIGRDPTKYILPQFLKNKNDLLIALKSHNDIWLNYFGSLGGMIYKDVKYLNAIIDSGNIEYMKFYKGTNWDLGFKRACEGGHIEIVHVMIQKGANHWNSGLQGACQCGNMELVKLMIEKGATEWNEGLRDACEGGHMDCLELMIENGAYRWDYGLWYACKGGNIECVELMIKKGAPNIKELFDTLIIKGHFDILEYLKSINKGCIVIGGETVLPID